MSMVPTADAVLADTMPPHCYFDTIENVYRTLPIGLQNTTFEVSNFVSSYATHDGSKLVINWGDMLDGINATPGLTFTRMSNFDIQEGEVTLETIAGRIVEHLLSVLRARLAAEEAQSIMNQISTVLKNVQRFQARGVLSLASEKDAEKRCLEYRLLFSVPLDDDGTKIQALAVTIAIDAGVTERSSWFGLWTTRTKYVTASVVAMLLLATEDFRFESRRQAVGTARTREPESQVNEVEVYQLGLELGRNTNVEAFMNCIENALNQLSSVDEAALDDGLEFEIL
ncbi:hypothetical protein BKA62DRAFT_680525 [Auriculariales sp. MPI-PUGE-AT-0066]|nr:hypothetical protein BKA62DRAFT_680525 [Auriculariales sp. MPI-PUGE-AT-0066]